MTQSNININTTVIKLIYKSVRSKLFSVGLFTSLQCYCIQHVSGTVV